MHELFHPAGRHSFRTARGSVAKIVKLEHAWRRLDGRNDDGFQVAPFRSEEHTSELQSLMRISYAVFCLKKKNTYNKQTYNPSYTTTLIKHGIRIKINIP